MLPRIRGTGCEVSHPKPWNGCPISNENLAVFWLGGFGFGLRLRLFCYRVGLGDDALFAIRCGVHRFPNPEWWLLVIVEKKKMDRER